MTMLVDEQGTIIRIAPGQDHPVSERPLRDPWLRRFMRYIWQMIGEV